MGFAGPVWHCSVSGDGDLRFHALQVLKGVGDESLGQWEEDSPKAFHVRRRLSDDERKEAGMLDVCDIRKTVEYGVRRAAMQKYLPPQYADWQE